MATNLAELVRSYSVSSPHSETDLDGLQHWTRLNKVLDVHVPNFSEAQSRQLAQDVARKHGFPWVVRGSFVEKFPYAASVLGLGAVREFNVNVVYCGDLPDFVLDRIERLTSSILVFTIHSSQPLPIRRFSTLRIDPIILGWQVNPRIHEVGVFRRHWKADGLFAIVVAAWDLKNEPLL